MKTSQLLAGPLGLDAGDERRVRAFIDDENWGAVLTTLTDALPTSKLPGRVLTVLAVARFRDGAEVMLDEGLVACRESLAFIDQALAAGEPFGPLAALREEVEAALSEASHAELRLLSQVPDAPPFDAVPDDVLADAAFALWKAHPLRAASLFEALAHRFGDSKPEASAVARLRAALCRVSSGDLGAVQQLEAVHALDWKLRVLRADRTVAEEALTEVLLHCAPDAFDWQYARAVAIGDMTSLPFPSVWPNQDRLLARCISLGKFEKANAIADAIEVGREAVSASVRAVMNAARARAVSPS